MSQRPLIFKWRHFEPEIILCAMRWYLRFSLSYRDVQGLLAERGLDIDHSTIWRWVQRFAPELNSRLRVAHTDGGYRSPVGLNVRVRLYGWPVFK